jgi:DNA-binding SARP family transcriptional activator
MRLELPGEGKTREKSVSYGSLSLQLFSSFEVSRDGVAFNGRVGGKARQLLKILAANNGRSIPRDELIETLWPESDPTTGANSLKVTAHNLRSALEPDRPIGLPGTFVIAQDRTYRLDPDADIWIDVDAFQRHAHQGHALDARGETGPAKHYYEQAEALYAGDYLEDDVYEDWTIVRREQLKDLYLEILGRLALMSFRGEAHHAAIRYCHKIVTADPCREDAYQMLMQSHGALNQPARAGAWYAVCRTKLMREVGSGPSEETVLAVEKLFHQVA